MSSKQVTLDVAAFLDSEAARALTEPGRDGVQKIAEIFLSLCYDDLGKAPRLLDGQDVHQIVGHLMPGRFGKKDPLAEQVPAVLEAYLDHLESTAVVSQSYEIRSALRRTVGEFQDAVRTGQQAHHQHGHHGPAPRPFVHGAPRLGRNDPCSCGSGKKFKKCHGKNS